MDVGAETGREPVGEDLDDSPERVAGPVAVINLRDHRRGALGVKAPDRVGVERRYVVGRRKHGVVRNRDRTDVHDVRDEPDAGSLLEEPRREGPESDPRRRLARRSPFKHRTCVVERVLAHPDEVGVAGARTGQRGVARAVELLRVVHGIGGHHVDPLGPLGVADLDRDGSTLAHAEPHSTKDPHLVLLERHPSATAVAEPTARQRRTDVCRADLDPGRESLEDPDQRLTVRLTRRQPTQHGAILP
ncbi:hypothetical protein GALL_326450 [mine drainage metagenome]|uniref:Uncharacterized protein n=1 Tax=mine drainage metagenome TaxID=410659 RepID=A0A1J5R0K9_9ZZZZ